MTTRIGAVLATASLAVAGAVLAATPASAAGGGGDCPAADKPPTTNTYYGRDRVTIRGTRIIHHDDIRVGAFLTSSVVTYRTDMDTYVQFETWDLDHVRQPKRIDCTRHETDESPDVDVTEPGTSGGGGSGAAIGGGGTLWMTSPGGGELPELYGTVGEVEQV